MKVLVVGATGAIGTRLVPRLIERGHDVVGTFVRPGGADRVQQLGATALALDVLDPAAVRVAVRNVEPESIIHQATALASVGMTRRLDGAFGRTNLLRTRGTDALLAAAADTGVARFVAQSFASARYARVGGPVKTEEDALDADPVPSMRRTAEAMAHLDRVVTDAGGIALRYGGFYGATSDSLPDPVRKRRIPVVGDGAGMSSFVHLDDAAEATVLALEHGRPGLYNIVDDDPAPVREWLPVLARALGAPPPRHVPVWVARLLAGEAAVMMATESRGASNDKARRELGWTLRYPSWRDGFTAAYATIDRAGERRAA